jgi:hypothetical protein
MMRPAEGVPVFRIRLIPRQGKFFENFAALALRLRDGAGMLEDMLASSPP